jgi:hypothetical protein
MKLNLTYWPIMRLVRLAVALGCFYAFFVKDSEWFILVIGIVAILQTLFNTKCADGSCEVSVESKDSNQ